MPRWWDRMPVPGTQVAIIGAGLVMQSRSARRLPRPLAVTGWPLLAAGAGLNVAAVVARGGEDLEHPTTLTTTGVHALTRNPIYVGWILIHLGAGAAARSPWVLGSLPLVVALIHREILREEGMLVAQFGDDFDEYAARVPRYVALRARPEARFSTRLQDHGTMSGGRDLS